MPGLLRENRLLNKDYKDILSAFLDEQVDFMVVGAYALAAHGLPRATGDIDLWIRCSDENSQRVWKALSRFGAPTSGLQSEDLKKRDLVFQIGMPPNRIDILTSITDVEFDEAFPRHLMVNIEGLAIPIIGRKELLRNKRAVGRPQDQADVARLESDQS